ncbi:MAG: hypothetical protein IJX78_04320 [Bacilli bacterium]|nr:hypothetical protein [Bacilli bacterium]
MSKIKYLLIIICIFMFSSALSSCKQEKMTETLEQQIIEEFQRCFEQPVLVDNPQLYIVEYYGEYNGAHIFCIDSTNVSYQFPTDNKITIKTKINDKTISNITLQTTSNQMKLWGYYDGLIYSVEKLYEVGFLTNDEVLDIWEKYCETFYELNK